MADVIRVVGLFLFLFGDFLLILYLCFRVRCYRIGMVSFVIGTAMTVLPLAMA